jgi:hypothetical protein
VSNHLSRLIGAAALSAIALGAAAAQAPRVNKYGYPEKHAPRPTSASITDDDLMTRLYIFADDSMQGRAFGRVGNMKGTNYIANEVKRLGLKPAGDNGTFFQRLPVVQRHYTDRSTITVDGATLKFNTDFVAFPQGVMRAPRPIENTQVVYGGNLADTSTLIPAEQAAGKFVVFLPAPPAIGGGGRGNQAASAGGNMCAAILNPAAAGSPGRGGFGGFGGFGAGAINLAARYPTATAFGTADLDLTPMGRRAFINSPAGSLLPASQQPPAIPRAPIVYSRGGVIATMDNGQVTGTLPNGMTAQSLQRLIDSTRADSIARVRRMAVANALEMVRSCATADSISVANGGTSMMGAGGIADAEATAIGRAQAVGAGRGGRGGQGGGGRGGVANSGEAQAANIHLTKAAAERLFGRPLMGLTTGTAGKTVNASLVWEERDASDWARNVVAVVPGSDPALKGQYVLVSAHNDHVGFNTTPVDHDSLKAYNDARMRLSMSKRAGDLAQGSEYAAELAALKINVDSLHRIRPARLDSINNGADDDGSGSMAILEIAEYISKMPVKPKRSTIFVWQTGEEAGLLGSAYFATHPTVPVDSIVADINIDMIGRGRSEDIPGGGPTYVGVVGSGFMSADLANIVAATNMKQKTPLALDPKFDLFTTWPGYNNIYGRSDHFNYARQCIPIAFFFTGLHGDYHQRTDEPQYIDYPHYSMITNYIKDVVVELGTRPQRPALDKACLR